MKRAAGAAGSVILHAALVAALLHVTARAPAPPGGMGPLELRLIDEETRLRGSEPQPMMQVPVKLDPLRGLAAAVETPCLGHSYRGIGIKHFWGPIQDIGAGSPAERAGLREGDLLMNDDILGPDRYPIGTRLVLRIERDGRTMDVPVTIGEICEDR